MVEILYTSLLEKKANLSLSAEVIDIKTDEDEVRVHLKGGSVQKGTIVIGADGVHSKTRMLMQGLREKLPAGDVDRSPMVSSFYGIFGRAPNDFDIKESELFESRGTGVAIQGFATKDTVHFVTLKPLPEQTTASRKYTPEEMEEYAESLSNITVFPGVKFGDIWSRTDKEVARMLNQEEGFLDQWHHGRVVLVGDAVHKMTSLSGIGLTCDLHSAAALTNELQTLLSPIRSPAAAGSVSEAFDRYQKTRQGEAKQLWSYGFSMTRELTQKSWASRFWAAYILPWIDMEMIAGGILVSLLVIRHGQILSYVPFEGKHGTVPWIKKPNTLVVTPRG